jgi:hypothetical protein
LVSNIPRGVGPERDGDAGAQQREHGVAGGIGDDVRAEVGGWADLQRDAGQGEMGDQVRIGDSGDAMPDAVSLQVPQR